MTLRDQLQAALGNSYSIERELGGGGMSRVFVARDNTLDRLVVVKLLADEFTTGVSAERFRREMQVVARLQHPHVVPILSAGASEAGLYYLMPYLSGETLRARITREAPLPVMVCVRILRELLDALAFAHAQGVIHRDVKPENILVDAGHAVVADFGIAKALRESGTVTSVGVALGTPAYMAPEQAAADPAADHRVDLYAAGVVAYEMLTGTPPFIGSPSQVLRAHMVDPAPPILQRRSDIPEPLAQLVMRALDKDPASRPASAAEMSAVLDAVVTPGPGSTSSRPPAPDSSAGIRVRRSRRPGLLVLGFLGALITIGVVAWQLSRPKVPDSAQSLAIAPFAVPAGDTMLVRMGQNLVTTVGANLDGVGDIRVTDGVAMLSHARSRGDLLSAADAIAIAQKVGARSVVHGTLVPLGASVRADAGLYDVSGDGRPMARVSVVAASADVSALSDSLTWALLRAVWNRGRPPTPTASAIFTRSPAALREFLDGERLFARGDIGEAASAYKRAVDADTTFWFAHYRYRVARTWFNLPSDTAVTGRLRRHLAELPERERTLIATIDSTLTQHQKVAAYQRIAEQYPDYPPARVTFADYLIHTAVWSGHEVRDAIEPWRQVVRLIPEDAESANHLLTACVLAAHPCADTAFTRVDSLARRHVAPSQFVRYLHRIHLIAFSPDPQQAVDSVITVGLRDSVLPAVAGLWRAIYLPATIPRPELVRAWDRLNATASVNVDRYFGRAIKGLVLVDRATRGDWQVIDEAVRENSEFPAPRNLGSRLHAIRVRALGELQGMIAADPRTAAAARDLVPRLDEPAQVIEVEWIVGLSALMRGDSATLGSVLQRLAADTGVASIARRSLRAIGLGRGGQRAAAAESLLTLERAHTNAPTKIWGAFAADRLLAAQWLGESRRYATADSLLRFTEGFVTAGPAEATISVIPGVYLERSRLAEGLGDRARAVKFATLFLRAFDLAPPSQRLLVDEAQARIRRFRNSP